MLFPRGQGRGVYHSNELHKAKQLGYLITMVEAFSFKKGNPLSEFVDFFFQKKKDATEKGNAAEAQVAKSILNSLSGRLGQRAITKRTEVIKSIVEVNNRYMLYTGVSHKEIRGQYLVEYDLKPNSCTGISEVNFNTMQME